MKNSNTLTQTTCERTNMPDPYHPDMTLVERDKRKKPYSNSKMMNPIITWAMIMAIVMVTGTGAFYISRIEADIKQDALLGAANFATAMNAIQNERDMRLIIAGNINENVDEVKEDIKELKKEMREDREETQQLLRELLKTQGNNS